MLPDGSEVWVCGAVGDGIVVIDTATHSVLTTIDLVGAGLHGSPHLGQLQIQWDLACGKSG